MQTGYDRYPESTRSMSRGEEVQRRQVVHATLLAGGALLAVTAITLWFIMVF
jgi:hypothetical protein